MMTMMNLFVLSCMLSLLPAAPGGEPCICMEPECPTCDSCCPQPECRDNDGDNLELCGTHGYRFWFQHINGGDGHDGLWLDLADRIYNFYLCLAGVVPGCNPVVDIWTSREAMAAGEPPVMTYPWAEADAPMLIGVELIELPIPSQAVTKLVFALVWIHPAVPDKIYTYDTEIAGDNSWCSGIGLSNMCGWRFRCTPDSSQPVWVNVVEDVCPENQR